MEKTTNKTNHEHERVNSSGFQQLSNQSTDSSFLTELFTFLKERIESPFFVSICTAWIFFNKDFVLYLIFYDGKNKAEILRFWEFSLSDAYFYPILLGIIFGLFINPLMLRLSGWRYKLSENAYKYAIQSKDSYQQALTTASIKILHSSLNEKIDYMKREIRELTEDKDRIVQSVEKGWRGNIMEFVLKSREFFADGTDMELGNELDGNNYHLDEKFFIKFSTETGEVKNMNAGEFAMYLARINLEVANKCVLKNQNIFNIHRLLTLCTQDNKYNTFKVLSIRPLIIKKPA